MEDFSSKQKCQNWQALSSLKLLEDESHQRRKEPTLLSMLSKFLGVNLDFLKIMKLKTSLL